MSPPLNPQLIIEAYRQGFFPMADGRRGPIHWYSPDPRGILPLDRFHIPKSLARTIRKAPYAITFDQAFAQVIQGCAAPRADQSDTWINREIIRVYTHLHESGVAHSIEAWLPPAKQDVPANQNQRSLVGGIYGLAVGGVFFGESMFSRVRDASKICLVQLVAHLRRQGYRLMDIQMVTSHTQRFGAVEISRTRYMQLLVQALAMPVTWSPKS
ncbi:MAG: leucyl/phenylalanyl-tRNA--protein transferase [Phycisphaeraceae bacterium]|nr:leucyl/phenylalanyl-tRNA--protein transferase [Phycisphaeraceae bacterium]